MFVSGSGEMCAMKEVTLLADDAKSKESTKQLMQVRCLSIRLRSLAFTFLVMLELWLYL